MREKKLISLFCRGVRVINVACGTGRLLPFLAEKGFEVVGIDFSRNMLNVARKKTMAYNNIQLIRCDAEFLPFRSGQFDEIICSRAFKLFPNPLETLTEWSRVLGKAGKSIVSLETSDPLWIKVGYKLRLPRMGSRFEWRYRVKNVQLFFRQAGFQIIFTGCVIYFGRSIYEVVGRYFRPLLKFLEAIDSHQGIGRNAILVGVKNEHLQKRGRVT